MTSEGDPLHPILERPWEFEIVGFDYSAIGSPARLDLTLKRGGEIRRLRFISPQDIELEPGFPSPQGPSGIAISDVSSRQLQGIRVRVSDRVTGQDCRLKLWAADVHRLV
jgi:hypothetical protein